MSELIVITTYYNPCHYKSRRRNYDIFISDMRSAGVPCITIECAFGDQPFELPERNDIIRVRSNALLWQKERLLNIAASWLPNSCKYVAWIDCDVTFDNQNWPNDLCKVLSTNKVAQLFETCNRLNQHGEDADPPDIAISFAKVMSNSKHLLECGRYDLHGHTGYAWAMHKSIFDQIGLYEAAISGSADHFMAHAIYGHMGFCIENALKHDIDQIQHLAQWSANFHKLTEGKLGYVPGNIIHHWHGDTVNRRYFLRMHEITDLGFNPWTDLVSKHGQPLEWAPNLNKPGLVEYFSNYFSTRNEDTPALIK